MYICLNDAANNAAVDKYRHLFENPGEDNQNRISIWYAIKQDFWGGKFAFNRGCTHVWLGDVPLIEDYRETLFHALQGEVWSPNGEARKLIEMKDLSHTSFSIGDVLEVRREGEKTELWTPNVIGWRKL